MTPEINKNGDVIYRMPKGWQPPAVQALAVCPYLGQPRDGDLLTVGLVCGCKANRKRRQQSFIVHDCAVQGRCLPAYTCSPDAVETFVAGDWAEPCRGCEKRPTAARPATAPAPARE